MRPNGTIIGPYENTWKSRINFLLPEPTRRLFYMPLKRNRGRTVLLNRTIELA
jgi:hypothetical protein